MTLSDTVEREMTGIRERMAETVRRSVEIELAEIKATVAAPDPPTSVRNPRTW